ncbi:efflux RND transporter periplasmic adaptor subunit [Oceaniglobus roseus]|uniref:efflux RND transporter periplasmic adaptor subunit n=1 Tax=Oceaniglobus roseus TaxID=1737570 RepID=UPI000C7F38F8|nr:efflux RND transporter periplasmic adaptor subunit [Kandeliimicrobium roseum]
MRLFSVLIALLVAGVLYLLVFERPTLLAFAGQDAPASAAAEAEETEGEHRVSVVALKSRARDIDSAVLLRGRTEAARQVSVAAETTGRIVSPPLRKGAFVNEGQLLCELDPGTREAQLAEAEARLSEAKARGPEAEARVAEAEARLNEAEINDNAASKLSQGGFASQTRVAATEAAVESARAALQAAKSGMESAASGVQSATAAVAAATREIEKLKIHAPFAGLLETDTAELGTLMQPGALCATILQLDPIKLVGYVPEVQVDRVQVGAPAGARLATGREVQGRVTFLSRASDPATRTFRTEIDVANADLAIRDGQTVEIMIAAEGRTAHLLPQSALTLNDEGDLGVRVVAEGEVARFASVSVVRDTPEGVWLAGLPDEVAVIVTGQEYVSDGVPLAVTWKDAGQ